jgi:hypothetical protein
MKRMKIEEKSRSTIAEKIKNVDCILYDKPKK